MLSVALLEKEREREGEGEGGGEYEVQLVQLVKLVSLYLKRCKSHCVQAVVLFRSVRGRERF